MGDAGLDTSLLDDEAFNLEAAQDRCILRLIASCCNGKSLKLIHKHLKWKCNLVFLSCSPSYNLNSEQKKYFLSMWSYFSCGYFQVTSL